MIDILDKIAQGSWHKNLYTIALYMSYALFVIAFTGVATVNHKYMDALETILKLYVGLFLIIRFNPWAKKAVNSEASSFDKRIAFAGGMALLLTSAVAGIFRHYVLDVASHTTTITHHHLSI